MSGSIDPWRSVTNSQHPDPDSVCDVMCPQHTAPTTRHQSPVSQTVRSILHFHFWFWHGARDVRLGPELRSGARDGRDAGGPGQATARPAARAGPWLRCERVCVSCEWSEQSETCEWWLCSSHCMAPHPTTKYAKKWRPWGGHTLASGLGFWPWLWQQTLLYRPQQPENHLGRP